MSAVQYPFIDIAAHERVRGHFAAGKALVLFSSDMADVLWANGRGAQLFGRDSVYDVIDQGPAGADLTFRQIKATARQLSAAGDSRTFVMRMTSGFQRMAVNGLCERIRLSNGEEAILIAVPASDKPPLPADCARQMLEGLDEPGMHMAVLDGDGTLISISARFSSLKLTPQTARMLVTLAENDRDRLVKRPVPTAIGNLPGAIARLSDEPALNLLLLVQAETGVVAEPQPAQDSGAPASTLQTAATSAADADVPDSTDRDATQATFEAAIEAVSEIAELQDETVEVVEFAVQATDIAAHDAYPADASEPDAPQLDAAETAAADVTAVDGEPSPVLEEEEQKEQQPAEATSPFGFRRETRTTRFVWKIDADGRFSEVSPELAASVGPHAAQVVGLAFSDVAALFNLDPDHKIAELLSRRDTWSGKTIWWPVEGTDLQVPIDLAALPTYTRNRDFDGFRGFGIVRMADVKEDPLAVGLTLAPQPEPEPDSPVIGDDAGDEDDQGFSLPDESDADTDETVQANSTAVETTADDAIDDASADATPTPRLPLDPPAVEKPVLRIVENPGQRHSDKVIRFDERRAQNSTSTRDGLSPGEQAAFREIARRLDVFRRSDETESEQADGLVSATGIDDGTAGDVKSAAKENVPQVSSEILAVGVDADAPLTGEASQAQADDAGTSGTLEAETDETLAEATDEEISANADTNAEETPAQEPEPAARQAEDLVDAGDTGQSVEGSASFNDTDASEPVDAPHHEEPAAPAEEDPETAAPVASETARASEETDGRAAPDFEAQEQGENKAEDEVQAEGEDDRISLEEAYAQAIPMRARPELSREIIDQMPVALLVHTGETLIHGNPEFLRLTGYDSIEALAELGGLDALLQRQDLEDKTADAGGMVVVRADDAIVPVTARLQSVRWEHASALILALMPLGDYGRSVPAPTEPDAEAAAQSELQAEEISRLSIEVEELRSILDTATDGVAIIDMNGEIRSMNRAASALFNYDNAETGGKPFVMLFAHESQKSVLDYLSGLAGHGVASLLNDGREVIGREASGGFLPLFMTIGHLTSSNGYCAVIRDITQWKRTEEELRNAKRAAETANAHKSDFLAHVSHEIRTPLNAIIGFADMMATERLGPIGHTRYVEYANDIGRSGRHVLDIVNDLLDISKIEAGEMELDFAAVGLNETVSEAVSLVQPQANGQRVIIRTALSQSVPPVVADLRSIKQIVLNILSNAIRFTPSGGQIVVSTAYEPSGSVVLRIRDTGIGMTRPELELAMKPFRQVTGAARKRGDGTGLGLPLTKAMVDANRASFSIHSAPNEGTLVEVTFPSPRVLAN